MERIMGIADNPVRKLLNHASNKYLAHLPILYILTVLSSSRICGLYIGTSEDVFFAAAELSDKVNNTTLAHPLRKVVVHLDPAEYRSTWLGNKSIYRTRMAIADGGELIVLAPGVKEFGEDHEIDRLIRKYGYRGTPATLEAVSMNEDLRKNLSAAAHLIHGSSEGRFRITYCPGHLSQKEIEAVGYEYSDINSMLTHYRIDQLKEGFNRLETGEEFYFIGNPAVGLWKSK
jgi:hypothetical protein